MNCEWYQEQISALIDQELDDEHTAQVFAHLGTCAACRTFLQAAQRIQIHLTEAAPAAVPHSLDARVRAIPMRQGWQDMLRSVRSRTTWWKRRLAIPVPAFGALVLMLLASIAVAIALLRTPPTQPGAGSTVYIMSLSPIEVQAQRINSESEIQ